MKNKFSKKIASAAIALILALVLGISAVAAPSASITQDQAKQTALDHAKLSDSQVVFTKTELDYDDGRAVYDIEFYSDMKEYDYDIDANSGKILEFDYDIENFDVSTVQTKLSLDRAKQAALENAGLSEDEVVFTKAKLDYDDGRAVYDIEFTAGDKEYDYEIDADTGRILDRDVDYNISLFRRIINFFVNLFSGKNQEAQVNTAVNEAAPELATSADPQAGAADSRTAAATTSNATSTSGGVTLDGAKQIALDDAKLTASQVTFIKAKLDYDDGRKVYDVEFFKGNVEYDYEIDAASGKILERDFDIEDYYVPSANTGTGSSTSIKLTLEQAKAAALKDAKLSVSDVVFTKAKLDYDDGRAVYDIEFKSAGKEYDYEIDAASGSILDKDIERDDDVVTSSGTQSSQTLISAEQAKAAALKAAGLNASEVRALKAELDRDDGRTVYEVEFKNGVFEYDYEIDASSGKVLKAEKEID